MDRKEFFGVAFRKLVGKGLQFLEGNPLLKALEQLDNEDVNKVKQRPPGASINENEFKFLCSGCDACMTACPVNVIMIEDLEKRFPLIYPDESPCVLCEDFPCINACPTGALDKSNGTKLRLLR